MKILWITPLLPCLRSGGQVRQFYLLRHLSSIHEISVLTLLQPDEGEDAERLSEIVDKLITIPFTPPEPNRTFSTRMRTWSQLFWDPNPRYARVFPLDSLRKKCIELLEAQKPDVIHLELLFAAPLSTSLQNQPWILSQQNVESVVARRWANDQDDKLNQLAYSLEARKLSRWEKNWV